MKNKKISKISALSVSCLMILSAFTGCGQADDSYSSTTKSKSLKEDTNGIVEDDERADDVPEIADEKIADAPEADKAVDDGIEEKFEEAPAVDMDYIDGDEVKSIDTVDDVDVVDDTQEISPQSGILTAGEWNDNENWGFFQNLVQLGEISFPSYGINPVNRTEITVKNGAGEVIPNIKAEMLSDDESVIWSSVTDKNGKAYFFRESDIIPSKYRISDGTNSQDFNIEYTKTDDESSPEDNNNQQGSSKPEIPESSELTFNTAPELYKDTEIMFIVDSTGSMADEMVFLQSEFSAIANEIGTDNIKYSVNFYRDEGDEYVTKCNGFTNNIEEIQNSLNNEKADGGGDLPEAVAEILDETLVNNNWDEKTVKLAFLIFDAPPHAEKEDSIINSIRTASEKGIRLIPVVSSNAERDTELFGRAISICTNGTYVFLTDDSGVGGSHLEPIIGDYEVEKLYDAIIRIINEYRQ